MSGGTPKTLLEAIGEPFRDVSWEPIRDKKVHDAVVDFLAQKFTAAQCEAKGETLRAIENLWKEIVGEKK
jgi:hypothetical protein